MASFESCREVFAREEQARLSAGSGSSHRPTGIPLNVYVARCNGRSVEVSSRFREVLGSILAHQGEQLDPTGWRAALPGWFVMKCDQSQAGAVQPSGWGLENLLYWFAPAQRFWFFWDLVVRSPNDLEICVVALEDPLPLGSFEWLLFASEANALDEIF